MRILKPILEGQEESVEVTDSAETEFVLTTQAALQKLIWHQGSCSNVSLDH